LFSRRLKQKDEIIKEQQNPGPSKDYSLKQGEKIKINFGGMKVIVIIDIYTEALCVAMYEKFWRD